MFLHIFYRSANTLGQVFLISIGIGSCKGIIINAIKGKTESIFFIFPYFID